MDNSEFKALLVDNISYLDKTCKRLQELDKEVFNCLSGIVKDWAEDNGWAADLDYWEDGELWIAKEDWRTRGSTIDESKFDFWFDLGVGALDKENSLEPFDYLYTTRLCRAGNGIMGLRLKQHQLVKGREFKKICETMAHEFAATPFVLDEDRNLFLPVTVSQAALGKAIADESLATALLEVRNTLDAIRQASIPLDRLVKSIREAANVRDATPHSIDRSSSA